MATATELKKAKTVCAKRGNMVGEIGEVIAQRADACGLVVDVRYGDGKVKTFTSAILDIVEYLPRDSVRRSPCGRFALVAEWCPQTDLPGCLEIDTKDYAYCFVETHKPEGMVCYRLTERSPAKGKGDPDGHTILAFPSGFEECTCGDYIFRRSKIWSQGGVEAGQTSGRCKHLQALAALDMLHVVAETTTEEVTEQDAPSFEYF